MKRPPLDPALKADRLWIAERVWLAGDVKTFAHEVGRSVRTVQRWRQQGLPIRAKKRRFADFAQLTLSTHDR